MQDQGPDNIKLATICRNHSHLHADRSKLVIIFTQHLSYLSTFFQSKLRLMTTGGAPAVASDGGVVPDRQGVVNAQHRPSAKSGKDKERESQTLLTSFKTNRANGA